MTPPDTHRSPAQSATELKRAAYAEGGEEQGLRAVRVVMDEGLARTTLIGRPAVIQARIQKFGLRLKEDLHHDVEPVT